MKKLLFLFIAFAALQPLAAQSYLRIGYSAGYYNMKNLDALVYRYNVTRTWLSEEMNEIHLMHGLQLDAGRRGDFGSFGISWTHQAGRAQASGTQPNGEAGSRFVKVSNNRTSLQGILFGNGGLGAGLDVDLTLLRAKTKTDKGGAYERTDLSLTTGISLLACYYPNQKSKSIGLRAWYSLPFVRNYIDGLGARLDPVNYNNFDLEDFGVRTSHFGASVSFVLSHD